jgi:F420-0:gamma-glutamyl ligase
VWSALEYAAHVRDVFALFDRRITRILVDNGTILELVDHDKAISDGRYNELDPVSVAADVVSSAEGLARRLEELRPGDWYRWGTRAGEIRTVLEVAQRAVHEAHHHLTDLERCLRIARGS